MCKPNGATAMPVECPYRGDCRLCPTLSVVPAAGEIAEHIGGILRQNDPDSQLRLALVQMFCATLNTDVKR